MVPFEGNPCFVLDQYEFGNNPLLTECVDTWAEGKKQAKSEVSPKQFHLLDLRWDLQERCPAGLCSVVLVHAVDSR